MKPLHLLWALLQLAIIAASFSTAHSAPPRLVAQPPRSQQCGQACVAMAAGVSLGQAIEAVGHGQCTTAPELQRALAKLGIKSQRQPPAIDAAIPPHVIVSVRLPGQDLCHCQLYWEGARLDPCGTVAEGWPEWWIVLHP